MKIEPNNEVIDREYGHIHIALAKENNNERRTR